MFVHDADLWQLSLPSAHSSMSEAATAADGTAVRALGSHSNYIREQIRRSCDKPLPPVRGWVRARILDDAGYARHLPEQQSATAHVIEAQVLLMSLLRA